MTAFNNSVTEGIVGSDSDASIIDFLRSLIDGLDAGDIDASIINFPRNVAEGFKQGDTVETIIDFFLKEFTRTTLLKAVQRPESQRLRRLSDKRVVEEILKLDLVTEAAFTPPPIVPGNVIVTPLDSIVYVDGSLGDTTVALLTPGESVGQIFNIKRIDTTNNKTTFNLPIDGETQELFGEECFTIHSDGLKYSAL